MIYENKIEYKAYGKYALFTDPITKIGGEKFSYEIPTYSALKGLTESIYWKPTFIWKIDSVRIMNPIQMISKGMRPIHYEKMNKPNMAIYTYLYQVEYRIKAHFEWNTNRKEDLEGDWNEHKHWQIAKRMLERGGRRDCYFGSRECQCFVEPCDFDEGTGYYDDKPDRYFGTMVHGITYPDEQVYDKLKGKMTVRLWKPVMRNGVIEYLPPDLDPSDKNMAHKIIGDRADKKFKSGENFVGLLEFDDEGMF